MHMHTSRIRVIKHEAIPGCGSLRFNSTTVGPAITSIGMISQAAGCRPETLDRETALEQAKALARGAESCLREG